MYNLVHTTSTVAHAIMLEFLNIDILFKLQIAKNIFIVNIMYLKGFCQYKKLNFLTEQGDEAVDHEMDL